MPRGYRRMTDGNYDGIKVINVLDWLLKNKI